MIFNTNLVHGKLIKRYNRFLADVSLDNGDIITAHCTNSGSMKSCIEVGASVYLTPNDDPSRRTKFTWEMIYINGGWVGVNTLMPNKLAFESISKNKITKLAGYNFVKREVKFLDSRFDIYAENGVEKCFIEVKNVTMKSDNYALFPDSVTSRGLKHLETLVKVKKSGIRAVMLYIIQRTDVDTFGIAKEIDPKYNSGIIRAMAEGVEVIAMQAKVSPQEITLQKELPIHIY
ncbi:MAG: DNA/RNA nuclease SfsA [Lentimicrobiaceae bacterium]|jgi:sugar fermentation stimulation protein A|nr:DNA/RNA nuclease SfsA [Lentimicrobiaceae bacterium]MBT3454662.1 DNA/RNA nuclease SfsA [Lentimicrobiaceae bacterium]MBT3819733.1 DNA/RNA nuclease SfsA [Lentimicrobiaceae bacterium]MBT4061188.1 DNA/RNA nuclease SfsA [Lentimicrobiaceae bacterium]MBT4191348.1 DNA/RNA nuclease SfsA [Lentimicrobiaceae bacterium]